MKAIYTLTLILIISATSLFSQTKLQLASCCEFDSGRCTGSDYCTACKNCSYCQYCNSGGSCGVCNGKSSGRSKSNISTPPRKRYNSVGGSKSSNGFPSDHTSKYYLSTITVSSQTLNLRSSPSANSSIMETLIKYDELVYLAMQGDWIRVVARKSEKIGYVNSKYVKF